MKTAETGLKAKKPVTVVQMVPELESGGVEEETLEVSRFLAEGGHCSMVISGGGRLVSRLRMEGGAHISWPVGRKNPLTLRYLPRLRNLLLNRQADILHIRSRVPAWLGYLTWKTIPRCRRPGLVTSFHGFYSVNRFSAIMAKGEKVIAVSRAVEDHIVRHYGTTRSRIVMIYGGYDEKIFNPALVSGNRIGKLRTRWDLSGNDDPVIMLPGRVTRLKGHDIFFKALKGIDTLAWTAICVGDPGGGSGYVSELEKLAADLGIENRVRFCGLCEDMPAAYALSDIVVSATSFKAESFGKTAVEAQAMGLVNDHATGCAMRAKAAKLRQEFTKPT
ncbi:MAG TPA: glycosyltransferase [Thermodesulfobacteriaceae bacterium]|nr:glycosyltransferase [Thermodesulfobacteriaceae bacterium]